MDKTVLYYFDGPAWRVLHNREEQLKGHVLVVDTSINGVVVVPNGFEGTGDEYVVTWAAWYSRPSEPRR